MPAESPDPALGPRELEETFRLDLEVTPHGHRLRVQGDLDLANTHRFAERLGRLDPPVIVDLSGVEFVDSSGIDALVAAYRRLGAGLVVEGVPARCWRVFELTGLGELLGIEPFRRDESPT